MKGYRDTRLLEMLDYIDPKYIEKTKKYYKSVPARSAAGAKIDPKKQIKYIVALVACLALLSAFIPAVTYIIRNHLIFPGFYETTGDETTLTPDITSEDITTSPETAETEPGQETTEAPYDGTTADPEPEYDGSRGLVYKLADDGKSAWLYAMGTCTDEDIVVASVYDGLPVTMIGKEALAGYDRVESIIIPKTVTSIGEGAFKNCTGIKSILIPDTVSVIGAYAFENCTSLQTLFLPDALEVIDVGLFTNCSELRNVEARNKVKRIITGAFYGCTSLTGLSFNGTGTEWSNVKKASNWHIGSAIKYVHCNTGSITISPASTEILENNGSAGLEYRLNGKEAILENLGTCKEKNIVIASTYGGYPVRQIGKGVFEGCSDIESVTIPETISSIGSLAFADCTSLKSLYIPASVKSIQPDSFRGCSSLKSIEVAADNAIYKSVNNCLIQKDNATLILACSTSVLPADRSITTIGSYAFSGIGKLTVLTIPEGVTTIAANAIHNCKDLCSVVLPSTITSVDRTFISGSQSISELKFPNGNTVYSGEGCCLIDKNTKTVLRGFNRSVIPDWVTAIGEEAFLGCTDLVSINFPTSLHTIGKSAFKECTSLEKIKIEGKTTIKSYAFMSCTNLREVDLGDSVNFDYAHIFSNCTSLESIRIPESVTRLVFNFSDCTKLSEITLHDNISELSGSAFSGCSSLKSIYFGSKIKKLPDNLFLDCDSLTEIIYNGTMHDWYTLPKESMWNKGAVNLRSIKCTDGIVSPSSSQAMAGSHGLIYEISADGNYATLVGFKDGIGRYTEIEIASTYYGKPVTAISDEVLKELRKYSGVIKLPNSLEHLEKRLFALSPNLKGVVIAPNVNKIGDEAFLGCLNLGELTFMGYKSAWEKIEKGDRWNYGAAFTVVHCLDGDIKITPHPATYDGTPGLKYYVSSEGYATFAGIGTCTESNIVIATNYMGYPVKFISQSALRGKTTVKSVVIPDCIEEIPDSMFYECTSLVSVSIPDTVKSIGQHAFAGCTSLTEIKLPASLLKIDQYAFSRCTSLKKINIPESVTEIGYYAFSSCDSIEGVYIPKSVTSLGWMYFPEINNFEIDPQNPKYAWKGNCFIDKETKTLITMFKDAVIPDDGSVEIIGEEAFGWESGITELILPEGVKFMRNSSFFGFEGIEYLHLPSTFEGFDEYALTDCFDLKKITVAEGNPYYYIAGNCLIDRRTGTVILGLGTPVIPDDGSIKYIGIRAFAESAIESVKIPEGVISIGGAAFYGCTSLKEVILPESLESIGYNAFALCSSLDKIKIGENVRIIEGNAFSSCSALEEIILPKQIESLGEGAFRDCRNLKRVVLPQGFEGVDYLFSGCTNIEEIVLPDGIKTIGKFFFGHCDNLKNFVIPEGVTEIDYNAFYHCDALESVVIPKSVTSIGQQIFAFCPELKDVYFAGTVEEWNAVEKGKELNKNSPLTVIHCSDGDVPLSD